MDYDLTDPKVVLDIIRTQNENRYQQLFHCINSFRDDFIFLVLHRYKGSCHKDKLIDDAKDAFQSAMMGFYVATQKKDFTIRASLKALVFAIAFKQLATLYKKEKSLRNAGNFSARCAGNYKEQSGYFFENDHLENENKELLAQLENDLIKALKQLPKKRRSIVLLKHYGKLKSRQIAEKLKIGVATVDNDTCKAYKALRNILQQKHSIYMM